MLTRCNTSRWAAQVTRRRLVVPKFHIPGHARRRFSTAQGIPTANANGPAPTGLSIFASLTGELDRIAPRFEIEPDQLQILKEPREFYDTLKVGLIPLLVRYFTIQRAWPLTVTNEFI